ncbi:CTP synthase [Candidatus Saccharibacteria bacterium]|nr:CTP synthase [Candidatus Saccharibacteria bacterium]
MPKQKQTKYIFVTGGVLSGVGKGITAASIGAILKAKGYKVSIQKCDPYLNVDAGLLNPVEHGECYVTHDGVETDLDLGHYERFLDVETNKYSITLSGAINRELIEKERSGGFHGKTVQMVPHFTGLVQEKIEKASEGSDVHIVEIGGTIGDYEGLAFVEAIRLFANKVGRENCMYASVVFVPYLAASHELKTKPAQNALKDLRGFGIVPDMVFVRTEKPAGREICEKIASFAGISSDAVVNLPDIESVYDVPFNVLNSGILHILNDFMGDKREPDMSKWEKFSKMRRRQHPKTVRVGLVAKYVGNSDTYICVTEALKAAAAHHNLGIEIVWVNAEKVTAKDLKGLDGIVVPGGFGKRGVEGKILAAEYALSNDVPYLGLCLGMQVACLAAARKGGVKDANSEEFGASEKKGNNVIYIMEGQEGKESTGGTMRLGDYPAVLKKGTKVAKIYKKEFDDKCYINGTKILKDGDVSVVERHRHRYEVNQKFLPEIEKGGIVVAGTSPDGKLVEFVEALDCKFFIATQAHPEFKSRPLAVHPLFYHFMKTLK